jgi:hypothetical protein
MPSVKIYCKFHHHKPEFAFNLIGQAPMFTEDVERFVRQKFHFYADNMQLLMCEVPLGTRQVVFPGSIVTVKRQP